MKVRNPKIEFSESLPHWSDNREFAQITNGGSMALPYLEPYLNKIMLMARAKLDHNSQLQADIMTFVGQEGHHYRQHKLYNRVLVNRYPALADYERHMKAEYDRLLSSKSFKFNCAYCEGFESGGLIAAQFFFEEIDDLLRNADPKVVRLWKWHYAEEYEHKTVCYDVYKDLFGGYFYRLYGLFYAMRHLGGLTRGASRILLEADRETMTPEERAVSVKREKKFMTRQFLFMLPRIVKILSPFYDPRRRREPRGAAEVLHQVDMVAVA